MMNLCPLTTMLALLAATITAQPCLCFFLFDHQVLLVDLYFAQGSCPNLQGKFWLYRTLLLAELFPHKGHQERFSIFFLEFCHVNCQAHSVHYKVYSVSPYILRWPISITFH